MGLASDAAAYKLGALGGERRALGASAAGGAGCGGAGAGCRSVCRCGAVGANLGRGAGSIGPKCRRVALRRLRLRRALGLRGREPGMM